MYVIELHLDRTPTPDELHRFMVAVKAWLAYEYTQAGKETAPLSADFAEWEDEFRG